MSCFPERRFIEMIANCENCKFFEVSPQYSVSGVVSLRQGHCMNKDASWYNFPRMDVYTCSLQAPQELQVVSPDDLSVLSTDALVTSAKQEKDITKLRAIVKEIDRRIISDKHE
jgi:hypothetical protein